MIKYLLVAACVLFNNAFAFDIKSKVVEVVIPFAPGGGVDQTYRHFEKYAKANGISTVPIYKPGAEGVVGLRDVAAGSKDGFRIGFATTAVLANAREKGGKVEVVPLSAIKNPTGVFVVHASSNIQTFDQLAAKLKTTDVINIASGASGQTLVWTQLFDVLNVPQKQLINYKGGQPVLNDLLGKHVDVAVLPLSIVAPHLQNGTLRILAHTGNSLLINFPSSVPLQQRFASWKMLDLFIVVVPQGLDRSITDAWNRLITQYVNDKETKVHFLSEYSESVAFGSNTVEESIRAIQQVQERIPKN